MTDLAKLDIKLSDFEHRDKFSATKNYQLYQHHHHYHHHCHHYHYLYWQECRKLQWIAVVGGGSWGWSWWRNIRVRGCAGGQEPASPGWRVWPPGLGCTPQTPRCQQSTESTLAWWSPRGWSRQATDLFLRVRICWSIDFSHRWW